jgi:pimeloyl-ACP methyl ester carboxylesterase
MLPLARPFHEAGMNVLLFDARNHGKSDGDSFSSMPRFAEDLDGAIDWTRQQDPGQKIIVMGHSIGAAAALLVASRRDDIDLVIGISGFAHPDLVMRRHLTRRWLPHFLVPMILRYVQWVIGHRFDDIAPMYRIRHVRCPVLLAHGSEDIVIPISDMHLIMKNALPDNDLQTLTFEDAGHASVQTFQEHAGQLIAFINDKLGTHHA